MYFIHFPGHPQPLPVLASATLNEKMADNKPIVIGYLPEYHFQQLLHIRSTPVHFHISCQLPAMEVHVTQTFQVNFWVYFHNISGWLPCHTKTFQVNFCNISCQLSGTYKHFLSTSGQFATFLVYFPALTKHFWSTFGTYTTSGWHPCHTQTGELLGNFMTFP